MGERFRRRWLSVSGACASALSNCTDAERIRFREIFNSRISRRASERSAVRALPSMIELVGIEYQTDKYELTASEVSSVQGQMCNSLADCFQKDTK
ncbi:uncharacterized protein PHACADRAFT_257392 [Phanerochaete carnosa HHB-10118-sp]|uniref:Uncharacterized protein n=1 Tax=Phanerochaete carnosa (strain HHB-10118-sp) TaxID=650164 RepID=K5VR20_PHACS|nr:uncharacterized protein PHACADRAFT_257392 [Phanerochaete carnosa HHB-10118-sp]EKM53903.1 hypothetical protein PHACADRAFT_257392 [Phanerochaete carnosa HHB-10118-sp]